MRRKFSTFPHSDIGGALHEVDVAILCVSALEFVGSECGF